MAGGSPPPPLALPSRAPLVPAWPVESAEVALPPPSIRFDPRSALRRSDRFNRRKQFALFVLRKRGNRRRIKDQATVIHSLSVVLDLDARIPNGVQPLFDELPLPAQHFVSISGEIFNPGLDFTVVLDLADGSALLRGEAGLACSLNR